MTLTDSKAEPAILVLVEVLAVMDPEGFESYRTQARKQMTRRGGVVVARGPCTPVEGQSFGPLLIQKWPSEAAFINWMESDEYAPLKSLRTVSAQLRICIVSTS